MRFTKLCALTFVLVCACLGTSASRSQTMPAPPAQDALPLFAVQVRVGPKWDSAKAPKDQALFREHSANLKRLRDAGHLIIGARYSDIGLIILAAESEESARAMMDADPSLAAGTFTYDIHRFNVFYPGAVQAPSLAKPAK